MWRAAERCSDGRATTGTPSSDSYDSVATSADPACFNTPQAPHNWEGFWWTLGLMELKGGDVARGELSGRTAWRLHYRSPSRGCTTFLSGQRPWSQW